MHLLVPPHTDPSTKVLPGRVQGVTVKVRVEVVGSLAEPVPGLQLVHILMGGLYHPGEQCGTSPQCNAPDSLPR